MITYRVETIAVVEAATDLVRQHYEEVAQFKEVQKLDPDWDAYERIEESGKLWVMTVRDDGVMVGYMVMMLSMDLHYRGLRRATEDIHYLLPEYRKGLIGFKLLRLTVQAMKEKGVKLVTMRTKAAHSHAALFERLGGELQDLVYGIVL